MRIPRTTMTALWALGALACGGTTTPSSDPAVESAIGANVAEGGLRLTNPTVSTIYYAVFERDWAMTGLFLWAACSDPATCPSLAPGATVTIPYSEIGGYTPEAREAIVYYWELRPNGEGYETGQIRSRTIAL